MTPLCNEIVVRSLTNTYQNDEVTDLGASRAQAVIAPDSNFPQAFTDQRTEGPLLGTIQRFMLPPALLSSV